MDEGLFLFSILCGILLLLAIVFCFLSTCLGIQIRRSDLLATFSIPTPSSVRAKDEARRKRLEERRRLGLVGQDDMDEGYEMGRLGGLTGERMGAGADDWEMMRRSGGRGPLY